MHIAILTFDGFNELDSFVPLTILNRIKAQDWRVSISSPTKRITSMNGVTIEAQSSLEEANEADVIVIGSGIKTRDIAEDTNLLTNLKLDPTRQLIATQCSGAYLLVKKGFLQNVTVCTDLTTKPYIEATGIRVLEQPFVAHGNIATAGGCLASQYLSGWIIARTQGIEAAKSALQYVAPVGEQEEYVNRMVNHLSPYLT